MRREHFTYVGTEPSARWFGYVAGRAVWLMGHPMKRTKPCLCWITHNALECPWCEKGMVAEELAYQPLYRQTDSKPVLILVYAHQRERMTGLKHGDRVQVGKEGGVTDPVWIAKALQQEPYFQTTLMHRRVDVDITDVLLKMWKIPEFTAWYRNHARGSDKTLSLPEGTAVDSTGKAFSPMNQNAAKRWGATVVADGPQEVGVDDALDRAKQRAADTKPSVNGKHKPR